MKWFISIYVVQLVAVARKLELVPSIFTSNESSRFFFVSLLLFTVVSNC